MESAQQIFKSDLLDLVTFFYTLGVPGVEERRDLGEETAKSGVDGGVSGGHGSIEGRVRRLVDEETARTASDVEDFVFLGDGLEMIINDFE